MSKLVLDLKVPATYNKAAFSQILREICNQVNPLSEGRASARYQAQVSVPSSVAAAVGDIVWDSNTTVTSGTVRLGWVCTVGSPTNATFQEVRALISSTRTVVEFNATISDGDLGGVLGTEVAATSGASIDFTSIPSWAKQIVIEFVGVSTSGTSDWIVQLGDAGGIENTGYIGACSGIAATVATVANSSGFVVSRSGVATTVASGRITLSLEDAAGFTWVQSGSLGDGGIPVTEHSGGAKSLSAALDRVRITTVGGTDTFDLGAINIIYQ